jgi:hypothetical protein
VGWADNRCRPTNRKGQYRCHKNSNATGLTTVAGLCDKQAAPEQRLVTSLGRAPISWQGRHHWDSAHLPRPLPPSNPLASETCVTVVPSGYIYGRDRCEQPRRRGQQSADVQTWGQPLVPGTAGGGRSGYQDAPVAMPAHHAAHRKRGTQAQRMRPPRPGRCGARLPSGSCLRPVRGRHRLPQGVGKATSGRNKTPTA